jgi:uncharacterized protein
MTEADMIELAEYLLESAGPAGGIPDLECLDGFLCGIVTAPELIPPSEWMPVVWGAEHVFDSLADSQRLTQTLLGYHHFVTARLGQAPGSDDPEDPPALFVRGVTLLDEDEEAEAGAAEGELVAPPIGLFWAIGFDMAHQMRFDAWEAAAEEWPLVADILDFKDALLPPAPDDEDDEDDEEFGETEADRVAEGAQDVPEWLAGRGQDDALSQEERVDTVLALGEMLQELHGINLQRQAASQTVRREGPKVGRNDPCPCGSGRKYKACHGGG